jgi:hypothetical protein
MRSPIVLLLIVCLFAAGCGGAGDESPTSPLGAIPYHVERLNIAVSGCGLVLQPSRLRIDVPAASPADIREARFYWAGYGPAQGGDDTILIDGVARTGTLVAAHEIGGADPWMYCYRLDAPELVTGGGFQNFTMSGFTPGGTRRGGAALAVIYRDPNSAWTRIRTVEPNEFVRWDAPAHERGAVWSFPIQPLAQQRQAKLVVVTVDAERDLTDRVWWGTGTSAAPAGDIAGATSGLFSDLLRSAYGSWLDVLSRPGLIVPANSRWFAYQLESPANNGDCLIHLFGAVAISQDLPDGLGTRDW